MTLVPGGAFIMGKSDDDLANVEDAPTKTVTVRSFYMDETEITNSKRQDFIRTEEVKVYPDTTVWIKDFAYSYNEPMHNDYFWHKAYGEYPVVGVTWSQAKAFCEWRTLNKNTEWEYAARGGLESATFPWGGPYTKSDRGCFLANFKPNRGDYAADQALYTVEAKSYEANGFNLYNMAGNVSEWTDSAYDPNSYEFRKVVRGGSWKDVSYFLQVSTRAFEYSDSARSYIGFRTVQDYMGTQTTGNSKK
uniref:Sulfatase-modifying factor enzyme-like domain-containing protein n=1 Tax=Hucho hucho TaxID=62062 RepID=A0A4W5LH51_9TELE